MSVTDPVLAGLAARLRSLTEGIAREVCLVVPIRDGVYTEPVVVSIGSLTSVLVAPSTVFRPALRLRASQVLVAHNHLDASPVTDQDRAVTRRLVAAGVLLGVPMRVHLVLGPVGWIDCCQSGEVWIPYPGEAAA